MLLYFSIMWTGTLLVTRRLHSTYEQAITQVPLSGLVQVIKHCLRTLWISMHISRWTLGLLPASCAAVQTMSPICNCLLRSCADSR